MKFVLPTALGLLFSLLIFMVFTRGEVNKKKIELLISQGESAFKLRLQALERLSLLMERIHPLQVATSLYHAQYTVTDLQLACIKQIKTEFEHNITQQIYISSNLWSKIRDAKEETISIISEAANQLHAQEPSKAFLRSLNELLSKFDGFLPTENALLLIKSESQQLINP